MNRLLACSPSLASGIVLGFSAILFGLRIDLPLLEPEEARYAEISRQMLVRGRFLVPIRDGHDYLDKPPLLYWLVIASYRVFGVHEWSARLPTVVAAWLTVGVVLAWGWRTAEPWVGVAGAAVLALTGDFVYRAPMATMNGPLAFFVAASLAAGHVAMLGGAARWQWWMLSALACALGVLMKGPVAVVLIAGPLFISPWLDRRLARPTLVSWLAWVAMVVAIAGPWFVAVASRQPEFLQYFLWKHHVERFATPFDHAGPIWAYVPQLALGFVPWSLVVAALAWRRFRASSEVGEDANRSVVRLALLAGVWGVAFFSLAGSKRPVYLVPVEPPLALAAGAYLWQARANLSRATWSSLGLATALAMGTGVAFGLPLYSQLFSVASVVQLAKESGLAADVPVFCYGHGWDSVGFVLERDDVKTYLGESRSDIAGELAKHPQALAFITTRRDGDDFLDILPAGARFRLLGENRQIRAGIVTREREP